MFRVTITALLLCSAALVVNAQERATTQLKAVKPSPVQAVKVQPKAQSSEGDSRTPVKPVIKPRTVSPKPGVKPGQKSSRAAQPSRIKAPGRTLHKLDPGSLDPGGKMQPGGRISPQMPARTGLVIPSSGADEGQSDTADTGSDTSTGSGSGNQNTPPPVVIATASWQLNNCQYRASITVRNDSSSSYSNLTVGIKQKAPHYSSWHGGGAVRITSLAAGQSVTKDLGWTRDIRATEFFAYVNETELIELDRETLNVGTLDAEIGQIQFSGSGAQAQWQAEVDNQSPTAICGGVTIVRKRLTGGGMEFGASNTNDLTLAPGINTLSGSWDATNASHFNLRFGADSGAARGQGFWTLDEKEVAYTP